MGRFRAVRATVSAPRCIYRCVAGRGKVAVWKYVGYRVDVFVRYMIVKPEGESGKYCLHCNVAAACIPPLLSLSISALWQNVFRQGKLHGRHQHPRIEPREVC